MRFINTFSVKSAALIFTVTIISKLLGLAREAVIAGYFGAGPQTDAFFVAFRIPDLLFNSLINFLIGTAFIPVFSECFFANKKGDDPWLFASNFLNWMLLILCIFVAIVECFTPLIISFLAPGLSEDSMVLTITLTRIMLPIIILGGLTGFSKSLLNGLHHFTVPAFIPVIYNLSVIFVVIVMANSYGIIALGAGIVAAAFLQFLVQVPSLIWIGFHYHPRLRLNDRNLSNVGNLMGPVILALLIGQAVPFFEIYLASQIIGAISYLSYANRIFLVLEQIYTSIVSTVLFASLSLDIAKGNKHALENKVSTGIGFTLLFSIPISFVIVVFSDLIVQVLLARGAFQVTAIKGTSRAFLFYSIGLSFVCLRSLVTYTFFALKDSKTLLMVTISMVPINIILAYILFSFFSYQGLAAGASLTAFLQTVVLFILLRYHSVELQWRKSIRSGVKIFMSSIIMIFFVIFIRQVMPSFSYFHTSIQQIISLMLIFTVASVAFFLSATMLKVEEAKLIWAYLSKRQQNDKEEIS